MSTMETEILTGEAVDAIEKHLNEPENIIFEKIKENEKSINEAFDKFVNEVSEEIKDSEGVLIAEKEKAQLILNRLRRIMLLANSLNINVNPLVDSLSIGLELAESVVMQILITANESFEKNIKKLIVVLVSTFTLFTAVGIGAGVGGAGVGLGVGGGIGEGIKKEELKKEELKKKELKLNKIISKRKL